MVIRLLICLTLVVLMCPPCSAGGGKVVLATLEWPPYTGESLPGNGVSSVIVREAFKAVGLDVELRFFPWNRLLSEASNDPEIHGYFPEYTGRELQLLYSDPIGRSPIGFAKRANEGRTWHSYRDLEAFRIGVVAGYMNTPLFDKLVASGKIQTNKTTADVYNLRKVLEGRVDFAVVDDNVFKYLTRTDPFLARSRDQIRMDPHLMDINRLFVCFRKNKQGRELLRQFNDGLKAVDVRSIRNEYMDEIEKTYKN